MKTFITTDGSRIHYDEVPTLRGAVEFVNFVIEEHREGMELLEQFIRGEGVVVGPLARPEND